MTKSKSQSVANKPVIASRPQHIGWWGCRVFQNTNTKTGESFLTGQVSRRLQDKSYINLKVRDKVDIMKLRMVLDLLENDIDNFEPYVKP